MRSLLGGFGLLALVAGCTARAGLPDGGAEDSGALDAASDVGPLDTPADTTLDGALDGAIDGAVADARDAADAPMDGGRDGGPDAATTDGGGACMPYCDPVTGSYYTCRGGVLECMCGPCSGDPLACC